MIAESEIKAMTPAERLRVMELIWQSLSETKQESPSPDWHGEVLSARLAKLEAGEGAFLSIRERKTRLASRPSGN
jgi:putative addiction module component (TIGR02574 family)